MVIVINILLLIVLSAAVFTDLKYRRIPNWQTVPALGLGVALNLVNTGPSGLAVSLGGGVIGLGLMLVPYLLGSMGAGDVKLLMAVGALKGWPFILWTACYAALLGGVLGIFILIKRRSLLQLGAFLVSRLANSSLGIYVPPRLRVRVGSLAIEKPETLSTCLPYGLAISLGALGALCLQYLR